MTRAIITVLLVEDDEGDYAVIRDLLSEAEGTRFEVRWASDVGSAFTILDAETIDVVLLAVSLADSHGWETFEVLHGHTPAVPVVLLTSSPEAALGRDAVRRGAQDYLVKGRANADGLERSIRHAIDRKVAERDLRDAHARFRGLLETTSDWVWEVDRHGVYTYVSPKVRELLGYEPDEVVGKTPFDLMLPADAARVAQLFRACLDRKEGFDRLESFNRHKNGRTVVLETSGVPFCDDHGEVLGFRGIDRDITEPKKAEDALTLYRDRLRELVLRRTQQLMRANKELRREIGDHEATERKLQDAVERLEAQDIARSEFISNVSHELRTPLSSVMYALENLERGVVGPISEGVRSYLGMIGEDCQRLAKTIHDILDLSRIEAHSLVLNRVKLLFSRFVEHAVQALAIQAAAKQIEICFTASECVGFAEMDPEKMERVVINIVQNAIKYTPVGGRVEIALRRTEPEPGAGSASVVLEVVDNGIGIDEEHLTRVTERYYRVGEHVGGAGLGLALCREILELHGGRVELTSPVPGRSTGTQVSAYLPAATAPVVLVVDDEEDCRELLGRQLARYGYCPRFCANGNEALDAIREELPDVLVIDLFMPVMDGVETIAQIKADHTMRRLPIFAVTGGEVDRAKREILAGFGIRALGKPWEEDQLICSVQEAVLGRQYAVR